MDERNDRHNRASAESSEPSAARSASRSPRAARLEATRPDTVKPDAARPDAEKVGSDGWRTASAWPSTVRRILGGHGSGRPRHAGVTVARVVAVLAVAVCLVLVVTRVVAVVGGVGGSSTNAGQAGESGEGQDGSAEEQLSAQISDKLSQMTLEQKVAQLFVVTPEQLTGVGQVVQAGDSTKAALQQMPVGGIVYFSQNLLNTDQTRQMLSNTQQFAEDIEGIPLLLAVDEEGGTVSRVGGNSGFEVENVGNMSAVGATGDTSQAREVAETIGGYLTDLGFNLDFAPDADIWNNPNSSTMKLRSFGTTADVVAPMVKAQVEGFNNAGILCCAKHFPGIGGAEGDSHNESIYSNKTADQMAQEELVPFQVAIEAGVPLVMVGHLSCPQVTGDNTPASLSQAVVTGLLRERLGYDGIVITDSLSMGAATSSVTADQVAVAAIKAGDDMVLMPTDLDAAYRGLLSSVQSGDISEDRIDESVTRILKVKLQLGE